VCYVCMYVCVYSSSGVTRLGSHLAPSVARRSTSTGLRWNAILGACGTITDWKRPAVVRGCRCVRPDLGMKGAIVQTKLLRPHRAADAAML